MISNRGFLSWIQNEDDTRQPLALVSRATSSAVQSRVSEHDADRRVWGRMAVLNAAQSEKFSSNGTIAEYAETIWRATPCPTGE